MRTGTGIAPLDEFLCPRGYFAGDLFDDGLEVGLRERIVHDEIALAMEGVDLFPAEALDGAWQGFTVAECRSSIHFYDD